VITSHPASWTEEELLAHCRWTFSRASGPGGQNRNKVETSAQIEFVPAGIAATASERRTQNENRKVALQRLRCKLAVEYCLASPIELEVTQPHPSECWNRYCRSGRVKISETNFDWPILLAEIMALLRTNDWSLSSVAIRLQTTSSQLVRLLKQYAPAMTKLNAERGSRGHRPLE